MPQCPKCNQYKCIMPIHDISCQIWLNMSFYLKNFFHPFFPSFAYYDFLNIFRGGFFHLFTPFFTPSFTPPKIDFFENRKAVTCYIIIIYIYIYIYLYIYYTSFPSFTPLAQICYNISSYISSRPREGGG